MSPLFRKISFGLPGGIASRAAGKENRGATTLFLKGFGERITGFSQFDLCEQLLHVVQFALIQNDAFCREKQDNKQGRHHQSDQFAPHGEIVDKFHSVLPWLSVSDMPLLSRHSKVALYQREGVAVEVVTGR